MIAVRVGGLVVVGAQWGDEGKGKIVDHFAADADWVVRYQGGANAGHTLVVDGVKTVLHLVPSGVLHPRARCAIGAGCVVDPVELVRELDGLVAAGVEVDGDRLLISPRTHLVLSVHRRLDVAREAAAGRDAIGTTGRGLGPAYEDAVGRRGVRVIDLADPAGLRRRVEGLLVERNALLVALGATPSTVGEILDELAAVGERVLALMGPVGVRVDEAIRGGAHVVFEGAQGALLDVLHGTYPFVTSSATTAAGAASGAGVGPGAIGEVLGVTKAYCTRVGAGPFPSELTGTIGETLRAVGQEFGATTGRPRRCGWLDAVALRATRRLCGLTALALTKLDVLSGLDTLQIATGYRLDGEVLVDFPADAATLARVEVEYARLPGWTEDLSGVRAWADLPAAAQRYVEAIEALVEVPVRLISVGPGRDAVFSPARASRALRR
jgi:adenylosuccinate synthase